MPRFLPPDTELALASHNRGKLAELRELVGPYVRVVRGAPELGLPEPDETGDTFVENAALKAREASVACGLVALADDSGLVVHALGGEPGVRSARWAGPARDFGAAMDEIHRRLAARDRGAAMICALVVGWPDGHVEAFEGRVEGSLVHPPRGTLGFGYEPMFVPSGSARTYGEMPRAEKHADDPRARAFAQLREACIAPYRQNP